MQKLFFALGPLLTAVILVLRQRSRALKPHSLFVLLSLSGFVFYGFSSSGNSYETLAYVWLSVGAALLGTSHLFIVNLLGGSSASALRLYAVFALTVVAAIFMFFSSVQMGAFSALFGLVVYVYSLRLYSASEGTLLLRLGFKLGVSWAFVAFLGLLVNPVAIDQTLHVLILGWAIPILFVLSLHITGVLAGFGPQLSNVPLVLLGVWQLVPLLRGFYLDKMASLELLAVIGGIVLAFWLYWFLALVLRTRAIISRVPGVVS